MSISRVDRHIDSWDGLTTCLCCSSLLCHASFAETSVPSHTSALCLRHAKTGRLTGAGTRQGHAGVGCGAHLVKGGHEVADDHMLLAQVELQSIHALMRLPSHTAHHIGQEPCLAHPTAVLPQRLQCHHRCAFLQLCLANAATL